MISAIINLGYKETDFVISKLNPDVVVKYINGFDINSIKTMLTDSVTFDPIKLYNNVISQEDKVEVLFNNRCPIITPYDTEVYTRESFKCSIYDLIKIREKRGLHINAIDLFYSSVLGSKLNNLKDYYKCDTDLTEFYKVVNKITNLKRFTLYSWCEFNERYYIWDGNKGLLLDENIGLFPTNLKTDLPKIRFDTIYAILDSEDLSIMRYGLSNSSFVNHPNINAILMRDYNVDTIRSYFKIFKKIYNKDLNEER
jgi:hypothetical protein